MKGDNDADMLDLGSKFKPDSKFISKDTQLILRFETDDSISSKGFRLSYTGEYDNLIVTVIRTIYISFW